MKALTRLKDEARNHELREDWEQAIQAYLKAVRIGEKGEADLELPLYNRIGDLYARMGQSSQAVSFYVQAADRYADAGLYNNAIALCNKALRYAPDHLDVIRKLGQFSASQGFLIDARRWFLAFAERASKQGMQDDALAALESFADIAEDAELRELLGRELLAHGRDEQAVDELRRAYRLYLGTDDAERADAVKALLGEIAPDVSLEGDVAEQPTPRATQAGDDLYDDGERVTKAGPGAGSRSLPRLDAPARARPVEQPAEPPRAAPADAGDADGDVLEGFQPTSFDTAPEDAPSYHVSGLEPTAAGDVEADAAALEERDRPKAAQAARGDPDGGADEEDDAEVFELPLLEGSPEPGASDEDGDVDVALPLLTEDGVSTLDADPPRAFALGGIAPVADRLRAVTDALVVGDVAAAVTVLETLQDEVQDEAGFAHVVRGMSELMVHAPDEIRLHQLRVEFAERSGDRDLRLAGYLELARALERTGAGRKAHAIYEHVREIDPENADARAALAGGEGYVDLKALLDLDEPSGATRYFVEEQEPTGDEDSDFAAILAQFKTKLAENVAPEDATAHYDLGIAFKEMGLVDEAIAEFQVALRAGDERLKIFEELGHCFLLKGEYAVATRVLGRALETSTDDELERIGVYYHLGRAHEELGQVAQAREAYERVMGLDISFQDVSTRLSRL